MSLLVAGSLHLDVVVRAPRLPRLDETLPGQSVQYVFGGKGGNQAVAASRMGAGVHFAGCAGTDRFGDMLRERLRDGGLNLDQLQTDAGASGMSTAIIDDQGDYGAVIVTGANAHTDPERIHIPEGVSLVLLQNELPETVNLAVARKARKAGAQVWLNAAPARALSGELTGHTDLLIVNRVEAEFYTGLADGPARLVTLGSEGVIFEDKRYPAFPVSVISTHGAGDMFAGALAARVAGGSDIPAALPFAQAAAALHVSSDQAGRDTIDTARVTEFLNAQSSR
ncbi:PfkB family carbohydrate kinase [Roseobacter sp. S98]|uniref:PfkB family carbohydrate kinase n=1 Tax=Roseobacter algicola (ex Choi et al. 2025) (nom. illeg.) TaxID=3092138 RepID=UPI003F50F7F3